MRHITTVGSETGEGTFVALPSPARSDRSRRDWTVVATAVALILLIAGAIVAVVLWLIPLYTPGNDDLPAAGGVTLAEVIDDPDTFVTERVTVVGRVDERLSDAALTLVASETGDEELLVIIDQTLSGGASEQDAPGWREAQAIEVSGTVRRFQLPFIEEVAGVTLDAERFESYLGQPVLVAERVDQATLDDVTTGGAVLSAGALDDRYDNLRGASIAVRGEIEKVLAPTILSYDEGGVLVVLREPVEGITDDSLAVVQGEVDSFDANRAAQYAGLDPAELNVTDLDGRPTIYATSIELLTSLEEISEEPARFVGKRVMVLGSVGEELGPNGFVYEDFAVLVITTEVGADLVPRADVRATGEVRIFDLAEIETATGKDLDNDRFREYLGEPAIVAETIEVYR